MGRTPEIVDVPERAFLMLDGTGTPASNEFQCAVASLFAVAYTLKFEAKFAGKRSWKVEPLEGLFTSPSGGDWTWTLMIPLPDTVESGDVADVAAGVATRIGFATATNIRLERFDEGQAAQVLHVGPYEAEGPTIELLHTFIDDKGYTARGRHHEIYVGDPRRSAPEQLKTIIRQPVSEAPTESKGD